MPTLVKLICDVWLIQAMEIDVKFVGEAMSVVSQITNQFICVASEGDIFKGLRLLYLYGQIPDLGMLKG
jgi:hypothetical protein